MNILIIETNEIKTLVIHSDPTDSLIRNYTSNSEFLDIDDESGIEADYAMSQEDFDWWQGVIDNFNKEDELREELEEQYGSELVGAVLKKHYQPSNDLSDDVADKLSVLNNYFYTNNADKRNYYHTLSGIDVQVIDDAPNKTAHFLCHFKISGMILPTGEEDINGDVYEERDCIVSLPAQLEELLEFDLDEANCKGLMSDIDEHGYGYRYNEHTLTEYICKLALNCPADNGKKLSQVLTQMAVDKTTPF